jgi:hypothetical protein
VTETFEPPARDVPAARPTPRTAMPFLVVSALGLANVLLPPYSPKIWHLFAAVAMVAVMAKAYAVSMTRVERTWVDLVAPLGAFPLIVVLRDATGGGQSGLAVLVAIPILWLAVFGTRRDLTAASVLAALTFALPVLVVGEPANSAGE